MRDLSQVQGMKEGLALLKQNSDDKQIQYILGQQDEDNDINDNQDTKNEELVEEDLLNAHFSLSNQKVTQVDIYEQQHCIQVPSQCKKTKIKSYDSQNSQQQTFKPTTPVIPTSEFQNFQLPSELKSSQQTTIVLKKKQLLSEIKPAIEIPLEQQSYEIKPVKFQSLQFGFFFFL